MANFVFLLTPRSITKRDYTRIIWTLKKKKNFFFILKSKTKYFFEEEKYFFSMKSITAYLLKLIITLVATSASELVMLANVTSFLVEGQTCTGWVNLMHKFQPFMQWKAKFSNSWILSLHWLANVTSFLEWRGKHVQDESV